jgi:hypothetical protein
LAAIRKASGFPRLPLACTNAFRPGGESTAFSGRHDSLAGAGCGEPFDGALYPIARAAALL